MLFSPESDVTTPTSVLRDCLLFSDIFLPLLLGLYGFATGDVAAQLPYAGGVLHLAGAFAYVEIQQLFAHVAELLGELFGGEFSYFLGFHQCQISL